MRSNRRVRLQDPLPARFSAGHARGEGRIQDISHGGFFVRTPTLLTDGTRVEASLRTSRGTPIVVQGQVRWNTANVASKRGASGFGVRVLRSSREYEGFVEAVLATGG